jgi:sugar phosphate isomerase/epimerase
MPKKKSSAASSIDPSAMDADSLDREIAILRDLIQQAADKQSADMQLEDQLELLDTVGKAAPALARLLKARRDLANVELDPAAMLRQALLELEEEWPELKKFGDQFRK